MKNKTLSVKQLRQEYGATVKIKHSRVYKTPVTIITTNIPRGVNLKDVLDPVYPELQAKGGMLELSVDLPNVGFYKCTVRCSKKDHYNRKRALTIGLARIARIMQVR